MKEKTSLEQLEDYVSSTLKTKYVTPEISKSWAFGTIDFALCAGLIDCGEQKRLLQKYELV